MKNFVSTTTLMLTVVGLFGGTTFADHQIGLADLAHDLQMQMNRVNRTVNYNFRTGPLAREMSADARDMAMLVEEIHELAETNGCTKTMAMSAENLCKLVCELKDHAAEIRPACNSRTSTSRYGCRFSSRFGSVGPTETEIRYLTSLLITMENTLEDMEQELVALNSVPALRSAPAYNAVPVQPSRFNTRPVPNNVIPKVITPIGHRSGWSIGFKF